MTRRDLGWRALGLALYCGGICGAVIGGPALLLGGIVLALIGLALIVQGRRLPRVLRIERSAHHALPQAVRRHHREHG